MMSEQPIASVRCDVENCVYNTGANGCCASGIRVTNRAAILGEETMCDTFEEA